MKYIFAVLIGAAVTLLGCGLIWALCEPIAFTVVGLFIGIINYPTALLIGLLVARSICGEDCFGVLVSMLILGIIFSIFQFYNHFSHDLGIALDFFTGTLIGALIVVAVPFYLLIYIKSDTSTASIPHTETPKACKTTSTVIKENYPSSTVKKVKRTKNNKLDAIGWIVIALDLLICTFLFFSFNFSFWEGIIMIIITSLASGFIIYVLS